MRNISIWARKYWKWIIGAFLLGSLVYWYLGETSPSTVSSAQKTAVVERGDLRVVVSGSGQVEAVSQVDLTPVIAGDGIDVVSVRVENNQDVKKGQIIAVLDTGDAARDIESAELNFRNAQIKQKQTEDLYKKQTKTHLWNRQLQEIEIAQSKNSLRKAQEKLSDYSIRAPFDGIVTGLGVEAGDSVARDTVLASVITPDMKVVVTLNEVDAARVIEGNSVQLSFNALPGMVLGGKVSRIATIGKVTQNVVSYEADIELDEQNTSVKPGMSVSADISVAEKKGVLLLPNAAFSRDENNQVTVKKATEKKDVSDMRRTTNRKAENESGESGIRSTVLQQVQTGLTNDIQTEIISGVNEGDTVVLPSLSASTAKAVSGGNILSSLFRGTGRNNR